MLHKFGYSSRKPTTAAQKVPENAAEIISLAVKRMAYFVFTKSIRKELIVGFDETSLYLVPSAGKKTIAKTGAREIQVLGKFS